MNSFNVTETTQLFVPNRRIRFFNSKGLKAKRFLQCVLNVVVTSKAQNLEILNMNCVVFSPSVSAQNVKCQSRNRLNILSTTKTLTLKLCLTLIKTLTENGSTIETENDEILIGNENRSVLCLVAPAKCWLTNYSKQTTFAHRRKCLLSGVDVIDKCCQLVNTLF